MGELGNNIQCFEETYPGIFWLGCNGLYEFNSLTGKFRDPFPAGIADILIGHTFTGFLRDQNQVYFASYTGIYVYDMLKKRLFQFEYPQNDSLNLLSAFQIFSPIKLKNGEIIAISGNHGINKINYDAQTGIISVTTLIADSVFRRRNINLWLQYELFQDSQGTLWMFGYTGLYRINPEKEEIQNFKLFENIEFPEAESIIEDNRGNLWIGTHFGLCRFNINTGQVKSFTNDDGVPHMMSINLMRYAKTRMAGCILADSETFTVFIRIASKPTLIYLLLS